MSCCGSKRKQPFPIPPLTITQPSGIGGTVSNSVRHTATFFIYEGKTALTVTGRTTGRRYHFAHTGARLAVDIRDAPGMRAIPNLRRG